MVASALPATMTSRQLERIIDKFVEMESKKDIEISQDALIVFVFDNLQVTNVSTSRGGLSTAGKKVDVSTARLMLSIFDDRFKDLQFDVEEMPRCSKSHEEAVYEHPDGFMLSNVPDNDNPQKMSEIQYLKTERSYNISTALKDVLEAGIYSTEARGEDYVPPERPGEPQTGLEKQCLYCRMWWENHITVCKKCLKPLRTMPEIVNDRRKEQLNNPIEIPVKTRRKEIIPFYYEGVLNENGTASFTKIVGSSLVPSSSATSTALESASAVVEYPSSPTSTALETASAAAEGY
jgi:hypothetical protein